MVKDHFNNRMKNEVSINLQIKNKAMEQNPIALIN